MNISNLIIYLSNNNVSYTYEGKTIKKISTNILKNLFNAAFDSHGEIIANIVISKKEEENKEIMNAEEKAKEDKETKKKAEDKIIEKYKKLKNILHTYNYRFFFFLNRYTFYRYKTEFYSKTGEGTSDEIMRLKTEILDLLKILNDPNNNWYLNNISWKDVDIKFIKNAKPDWSFSSKNRYT